VSVYLYVKNDDKSDTNASTYARAQINTPAARTCTTGAGDFHHQSLDLQGADMDGTPGFLHDIEEANEDMPMPFSPEEGFQINTDRAGSSRAGSEQGERLPVNTPSYTFFQENSPRAFKPSSIVLSVR
jgi:hypothetical protein